MKYIAWITLGLAFTLVIFCAFNLFYPYDPITFTSPAKVLDKQLRPGDVVQVVLDYNKHVDAPCKVTRQFVDGIIYTMPPYDSNLPIGHNVRTDVSTQIPATLPAGHYYCEIALAYKYPPFRTVTVRFKTEEFDVIR